VGFFVIENHLLYTTNGLVTQGLLEELWSASVVKIANTLRTHVVSFLFECIYKNSGKQLKNLLMLQKLEAFV